MVLLTMTPAMVDAIREYRSLIESDPVMASTKLDDELPGEDAAVGNPISHGQVVDLSRTLLEHFKSHEMPSDVERFHLDRLLRGSKLYVPPAKPKAEPVSAHIVHEQAIYVV